MSPEYRNEIRVAVCRALIKSGRYMLSQNAITMECKATVSPEPNYSEVSEAIASLDREGFVVCGRATLTGEPSWKLTQMGQAAIKEV